MRLQVADLGRSIAFYEDVLGLEVHGRTLDTAKLGPAGGARVLVELHERPGAVPVPRRGSLGLFHFAVLLPDRAALGRFVPHALARGVVDGASDHAVSEAIYLSDPDGLGIEVYADRPRERWQRLPSGELSMVTEPLDLGSLVEEAAGVVWSGAPAGTVMGHVHLRVGNLAEADAFYHGAIGLDRTVWSYPGALFFSAGGYHHHLGTNTWGAARPAAENQAQLLSWDLELPDEAAADAAAQHVAQQQYSVQRDDMGWAVRDPWGTVVRLRAAQR